MLLNWKHSDLIRPPNKGEGGDSTTGAELYADFYDKVQIVTEDSVTRKLYMVNAYKSG